MDTRWYIANETRSYLVLPRRAIGIAVYVNLTYDACLSSTGSFRTHLNDQLPVSLIAQLVEQCTGVAEVMGSIPLQA